MKAVMDKTVTLTLSTKEAFWLKAAMQNPSNENEAEENEILRKKLFTALPTFEELSKLFSDD